LQTCIDAIKAYQPNYAQSGFNVGWFGGEPLMNWETIYQFSEWAKKEAAKHEGCLAKSKFHITTNAVLITEEIAEYLAANNFSLIISLDGGEEEHNNSRPYANSTNNSWKDTMRGLEFVHKAYKKAGKYDEVAGAWLIKAVLSSSIFKANCFYPLGLSCHILFGIIY
jgi:uncharacterized protein